MIHRLACALCCALFAAVSTAQIAGPGDARFDRLSRNGVCGGVSGTGSVAAVVTERGDGSVTVELSRPRLEIYQQMSAPFVVEAFPLTPAFRVDLELTPFRVAGPDTVFVMGSLGGPDRPLNFDPASVILLRGTVRGADGSHVYLALGNDFAAGTIDLGSLGERYAVESAGGASLRVARATPQRAGGLGVPMCGLDTTDRVAPPAGRGVAPAAGLKRIRLAVETDYELAILFDSPESELAYILALYGAVSDIYLRDVGAGVELSFVRLWDTPDDLFNGENPLGRFRNHWNDEMGHVVRDSAQFFSGRRNLPWGGVAYLNGLCQDNGYSVAGYALGSFPDTDRPSVFNRDIIITAHELGHNVAAPHTQGVGIDRCDDPDTIPQRGTLMSYCGQTFTGGDANHDLRFHSVIGAIMREALIEDNCIDDDCNANGVPDDLDITSGTSTDDNTNGVPDECEDCNANGILDDDDIASGTSLDLNTNGVPDECEPDCNNNDIPDDLDIADETSTDDNGDGVPDECAADRNENGISDYAEIQADMSRDLDRDAILDATADCDGDGVPDLTALDGANDMWIATLEGPGLRRYLSVTGTLVTVSDDAGIQGGNDVLVLPDRRVLVSSGGDDRVVAFDADGAFLGDLVPSGTGGLDEPAGLALAPDGTLLVASAGTDSVLAFDRDTGEPLGDFIPPGSGGLERPFGLAFGPGGDLFVTSDDGRVLRFDGGTGSFIADFVTAADNAGLDEPRGLAFMHASDLLVASHGTDEVLRFDRITGSARGKFNLNGTEEVLTLDQPWGVRIGPDSLVYVSRAHDHAEPMPGGPFLHLTNARVYIFDPTNGNMLRAYIQGVNSGIEHAAGFDFLPGDATDCNRNLLPDSCDIAAGTSLDANANGVPDECEVGGTPDCAADFADPLGSLDFFDLQAFLGAFAAAAPIGDINNDGAFDFFDVQFFLGVFSSGCP